MKLKLLIAILFLATLVACGGNEDHSAFSAILDQPPYASITDSIRKQPDRDQLYFRRAVLLNTNNLPEPALADFKKAWSIAPTEPYAMGIVKILMDKRPDSAAIFIRKALQEIPTSIFLQLNLARAYDAMGKPELALDACDNLLKDEPGQVNALLLKADLLIRKDDQAGALAALEEAYRSAPGDRELANKLAYQYAELKQSKAIALTDSLEKTDTLREFPEPSYIRGVYYTNINDPARAIRSFDQTLRTDHRYLNAYIEKGKIQFNQRQWQEALRTFSVANSVTPSFPDAWYWIGRCQEALGDKEEALLNYEKAYSLDKSYTDAKEAIDRIK